MFQEGKNVIQRIAQINSHSNWSSIEIESFDSKKTL